jgi:hypothetical protein
MPKIDEKILYDNVEDKLIVKRTYDDQAELDRVAEIRKDSGINSFGSDYKFVGSVPTHLIAEWLKEAGVSWDDSHAAGEVIKRKMMSGEFDRLRAWKGKY